MSKKRTIVIIALLAIIFASIVLTGYVLGNHYFDKGKAIGNSQGYQRGFNDGVTVGELIGFDEGYTQGFNEGFLKGSKIGGQGYLPNVGQFTDTVHANQPIGPFPIIVEGTEDHPAIFWMRFVINIKGLPEDAPIFFIFFLADTYFEDQEERLIFNINATATNGVFDNTVEYQVHHTTELVFAFVLHDVEAEQAGERYTFGFRLDWYWLIASWVTVLKEIELPTTEGEYYYAER